MGRWDTGRGGGHWCLAAASIAAEVTVIQVAGLWAFPTQWRVVRVCVGEEPEFQVSHPHGGCPDSMGGVLVSWATMQGGGRKFYSGCWDHCTGVGVGAQVVGACATATGFAGAAGSAAKGWVSLVLPSVCVPTHPP